MHITVVTITNRARWRFLERTVNAALQDGAARVLVVDNESQEDIAGLMDRAFPGRHRTIRLEPNQGAAGAYFYGLRTALEDGAEYLLLLDDDNAVKPGAIASLQSTYQALLENSSRDLLCVAGLRMDQENLRGAMPEPVFPSGKDFLGFEFSQLLTRPWKRLPWVKRASANGNFFVPPDEPIRRKLATFGGMFFHRSLIERFGYPDPGFVLYCDDVEFTNRIASNGGAIWLDPHAEIEDIDPSWTNAPQRRFYFQAWIELGSDEQVYYTLRNRAYLETRGRARSWKRSINRAVLIPILWAIAVRSRRLDRFHLVMKAVRLGEAGRLEGRRLEKLSDSARREADLWETYSASTGAELARRD